MRATESLSQFSSRIYHGILYLGDLPNRAGLVSSLDHISKFKALLIASTRLVHVLLFLGHLQMLERSMSRTNLTPRTISLEQQSIQWHFGRNLKIVLGFERAIDFECQLEM